MAGFVLGALESQERQDLLGHIRNCVLCHILAEEHMEVGAALAAVIPEVEAPASLRIQTLAAFAQRPVQWKRPIARVHNWPRPGLGWPSGGGTKNRRPWKWTGN